MYVPEWIIRSFISLYSLVRHSLSSYHHHFCTKMADTHTHTVIFKICQIVDMSNLNGDEKLYTPIYVSLLCDNHYFITVSVCFFNITNKYIKS